MNPVQVNVKASPAAVTQYLKAAPPPVGILSIPTCNPATPVPNLSIGTTELANTNRAVLVAAAGVYAISSNNSVAIAGAAPLVAALITVGAVALPAVKKVIGSSI